jgi:acyl carrier protein
LNEKPIKEADLSRIKSNLDDIVWEFAVRFYSESGHKAEFIKVRSIVDSWVKSKEEKLIQKKSVNISLQNPNISSDPPSTSKRLGLPVKLSHAGNQQKKSCQNEPKEILKYFNENEERVRIFNKFSELASEQLGITLSSITLETNLSILPGIDTYDALELYMAVEEEFEIEIDDSEVEGCVFVKSCVDLIYEKIYAQVS